MLPFFIERGLSTVSGQSVQVKNHKLLDILSLVSFLGFAIADVFLPQPYIVALNAGVVATVTLWRLLGWYHRKLWEQPLLWSLFVAFLGVCLSFVLFSLQP